MTDKLREAAQMALDALELVTDLTNHDDEVYAAIDALRARLAQPEHGDGYRWREGDVPPSITYTTPPQREWVGLTEGETIDLALSAFELPEVSSETREKIHRDLVIAMNDQDSRLMLFAANIEAKLKEKNND